MSSSQVRTVSVQGLVQRDQAQKSVPQSTVNTVIAVTVILGVIFVAFALFVIYWMYMRSIDRRDRREQKKLQRLTRLATSRKQKDGSPRFLQQQDKYKEGSTKSEYGRPWGGNVRSPGKYDIPKRRSLAHQIYGLEWPKSYSEPISSYREPYPSPFPSADGPRERDVEVDLEANNGAAPRNVGHKGTQWYPFHSVHHNSSRSFSSSFSDSGSNLPYTRQFTPLPKAYHYSASNGSEETGHAGFPLGFTPRNPPGMSHHSDDTGLSNSHHT